MEQCRNTRAKLHLGVTGVVDVILTRLQPFWIISPKGVNQGGFIPQKNKNIMQEGCVLTYGGFWCGLGYGSLWLLFKVSRYVMFESESQLIPSRLFPTASILSFLGHALSNNERTYYQWQKTNSIQWPLLGGAVAGLCVESQHGHNVKLVVLVSARWCLIYVV